MCGATIISQRIDYLNLPFHCNFCHNTGHLRNTCSLFRKGGTVVKEFEYLSSVSSPSHPVVALFVPTPEDIYTSSSPSPYDGLSKGELMFIEDT